jgi:HSP20 family protein
MTLSRWSPVTDLATFEVGELNDMFDRAFRAEAWQAGWAPAVDIYETPARDFVVKLDLPDVKRDAIKVSVEDDVLTVSGERTMSAEVPRERYHRMERAVGTFRRSFTLPASVDAARVGATFADGVLTVTLPQREEAKPRQIQVNG